METESVSRAIAMPPANFTPLRFEVELWAKPSKTLGTILLVPFGAVNVRQELRLDNLPLMERIKHEESNSGGIGANPILGITARFSTVPNLNDLRKPTANEARKGFPSSRGFR